MAFIRRVFYDQGTGMVTYAYMMQGDIAPRPADADAAQQGLSNYGVMEWPIPDPDIEAQFADDYNNHITVDVTVQPPALVFGHEDPPAPPAEPT